MRWIAAVIVLLAQVVAVPAHAAEDISFWVFRPGTRTTHIIPYLASSGGTSFGASGPIGARVGVTIDLSGLDESRVTGSMSQMGELPQGCTQNGAIVRCTWDLTEWTLRGLSSVYVAAKPGVALGPAGSIRITGERLDLPDADTSNNSTEILVDVRGPGNSTFTVKTDDARGSVGDTVTVAVTFVNKGPNSLRDMVINRPSAGGGRDFKGGTGCVLSPAPRCEAGPIAPGATKVMQLKFFIRRCFRPVPEDPDYGASVLGEIPLAYDYGDKLEAADLLFELKVNGCVSTVPGTSAGSPSAPAEPSEIASPVQSAQMAVAVVPPSPSDNPQTQPVSNTVWLASRTATGLFLTGIAIVLCWRWRRRREGL